MFYQKTIINVQTPKRRLETLKQQPPAIDIPEWQRLENEGYSSFETKTLQPENKIYKAKMQQWYDSDEYFHMWHSINKPKEKQSPEEREANEMKTFSQIFFNK